MMTRRFGAIALLAGLVLLPARVVGPRHLSATAR